MSPLAIIEAFQELPDRRRGSGRRHSQTLCLSLFTLAVSAGCRGFLAMSDWLDSYQDELLELFSPSKNRLPSYSTIRRVLLNLDYEAYSLCLAHFFKIQPKLSETIALDGKVLRHSSAGDTPASTTDSPPAIQRVDGLCRRTGLIVPILPVDSTRSHLRV